MSTPQDPQLELATLEVATHVVSRLIQGRALVLDPQKDEIQQLNEVGSHLWTLLTEGGHTRLSLARSLTEGFEVELEEALMDVKDFVQDLSGRGFVIERPAVASSCAEEDQPKEDR